MADLTLSDLIRKGGAFRPQIQGALKDSKEGVCALGAAIEAAKDEGLIERESDGEEG